MVTSGYGRGEEDEDTLNEAEFGGEDNETKNRYQLQ